MGDRLNLHSLSRIAIEKFAQKVSRNISITSNFSKSLDEIEKG
jgi:hypothetical protein